MLSAEEIYLNKIAQEKISIDTGIKWFENFNALEQRQIISLLRLYLEQSHPSQKLIDKAILSVPLKQTMTPIAIFKTNPFKIAAIKVSELPDDELKKSFITFICLFKETDKFRRMNFCRNGCTHEWHNLDKISTSKPSLLKQLLQIFRTKV